MICDCGEESFLIPLHGGKGGPLRCPLCVGKWNAEHGRRRRTGRVVIRAMKAFFDAGGKLNDIDRLKWSARCGDWGEFGDQLGYMDGIAELDGAADLSSELLAEVLRLVHPDVQPPERQDLARHVTQQLLALQPFVFPAAKPKPVKPPEPISDNTWKAIDAKMQSARYPCADCADTTPMNYCKTCKAEYDKRELEEAERNRAKWRATYAKRRQWTLAWRKDRTCPSCQKTFKSKRNDARYCSARCRQKAHRTVTDKPLAPQKQGINRDKVARAILALVDRHRAIWLNDLLPDTRTKAQYQAVALIAAKLEAENQIESWHFPRACAWDGEISFKALSGPGLNVDHLDREEVHRLTDNERLRL
jgi:hypothetical protein